ncbi:hypothetical protein [Clostridium botulinum]|nr:hypothetical protein [Clostridium botulinum]
MEYNKKKEKKDYVYSIRINRAQRELLKKNECIKEQLDLRVIEFFKIYGT